MFIAGPGFGLTLMLNIEQYEYTRDPSFGVGIKVLLVSITESIDLLLALCLKTFQHKRRKPLCHN